MRLLCFHLHACSHCMSSMSLWPDSWCFDIPGVLTRLRPHSRHITQCKTTQLFWWNIFHWNMLSPLAQVLCYAKHVLLFWNVGSLMSINTSNAEERFLWSWLLGAAFGGVIVLGSGESTDRFWASSLLVERNQMIKPLQSVFAPRTNTSGEHLRTEVIADWC